MVAITSQTAGIGVLTSVETGAVAVETAPAMDGGTLLTQAVVWDIGAMATVASVPGSDMVACGSLWWLCFWLSVRGQEAGMRSHTGSQWCAALLPGT